MSEEKRGERLYWQCRRGMLELDLLLIPFLEQVYPQLSAEEQANFKDFLSLPDPQLYAWLMQQIEPEEEKYSQLVAKIRENAHKTAQDRI